MHACQTQRCTNGNLSDDDDDDDDDCSDGDDDDECNAHTIDLRADQDQDEDVIQAAEEAQEGDLDAATEEAELAVMVTDGEQKSASTALSKVCIIIYLASQYLLITLIAHKTRVQGQ